GVMDTRTIGAFFDFDKTLIDVDSPSLGIRYLWEHRLISMAYILKVMSFNFFYQRHLISDDVMARVLISFYRDKPFAQFEAGSQEYYEEVIRPHLAPNIVERVKVHKAQGHTLVLISAGLRYLLKPVASDLRFDHLVCTDLEVGPDGVLTGRTVGPVCTDNRKRELAKKLADEVGMDLAVSYAYGNHQSDIPMLELVGHPHAVEPTEQLRKTAMERGWPILSFR
ncbi:MAG: HAD family hydrolase, partial [Desulfomonilia bacterium]